MLLRNKRNSEVEIESKEEEKQADVKIIKSERKIQSLKTEIERLKEMLNQKEINSEQNEKYAELLSELYEKGIPYSTLSSPPLCLVPPL